MGDQFLPNPALRHVIVVQPAIPAYRIDFFRRLSLALGPGFSVWASEQKELGLLDVGTTSFAWRRHLRPKRRMLPGLYWQGDALSIPLNKGSVLVVSGEPRTLSTLLLIAKAKIKGVKVVWWGHFWSATSRPWRAAIRFALMRLPDALLFYTDQEVDEYCARRPVQSSQKSVFSLNNGISIEGIATRRAPYEPNSRPRDLLFIGRITAKAQLGDLLKALARPGCLNVTLDVIGDGEATTYLQQEANRLDIADRIAWHGASTDEDWIAEVANKCKAFVYPGAVGLSLIHGLGYGLPAIVHDNRWQHMPEIAALRPGKNGVVFRQGVVDALAESIAGLLRNPVELAEMSQEAVETTRRSFNTSNMAERFIAMIKALE